MPLPGPCLGPMQALCRPYLVPVLTLSNLLPYHFHDPRRYAFDPPGWRTDDPHPGTPRSAPACRCALIRSRGKHCSTHIQARPPPPRSLVADAVLSDTYLFIIVSGFTTALQLREPPRFAALHSPTQGSEASAPALALRPRRGVSAARFLLTRAVGLFPILWLGLVLFLPAWIEQTVYHEVPLGVAVGCPALYAVGMQSWWRPACHYYGPNRCAVDPPGSAMLARYLLISRHANRAPTGAQHNTQHRVPPPRLPAPPPPRLPASPPPRPLTRCARRPLLPAWCTRPSA